MLRWVGRGGLLLPLFLLVACAHRGPPPFDAVSGPPTTCAGAPSAWVDWPIGRDILRFSAGLEADGARAAAGVLAVHAGLSAELGVPADAIQPTLFWLTTASPEIRAGFATTLSTATTATVYLSSPTCDGEKRPRQHEKTLAHELSGLYLHAAVDASPAGWEFWDAPAWFVQGSEEWVTTLVHARPADIRAAAEERAVRGVVSVRDDRVAVEDPYRDGEALVAWLVLTRGQDVLRRILASDAPTFDAAFAEVVGVTLPDAAAAYLAWRATR